MPAITPPMNLYELTLRLVLATTAGALIGLNREMAGKPAGLRTHALVALGAASTVIVGLSFADPSAGSRVLQGVVAGIGFIGGGVILRDTQGVHGLTTASSIWLVSAVGVAAGAGLWWTAGLVVMLGLLVLIAGKAADRVIHPKREELPHGE